MVAAAAATASVLLAAVPAAATGPTSPRCYGAASRDRAHPCRNPALRRTATPTPSDALLMPDPTPCEPIEAPFRACRFGVDPERATRIVALVGDSHAEHWRPALDVVARRLRWSVYSITRGSCPLTLAVQDAPPAKRDGCIEFTRQVLAWLPEHPEISAIVTSQHIGPVVRESPRQSMMSAWVKGIGAAWKALPASIRRILVIRDVPFIELDTLPCVQRAIADGADAGRRCAMLRRRAVHRDPHVLATRRHPERAQLIDLTDFFCGRRRCPPVIGGVLVYKDYFDHLTPVFARTLGPYLIREVRRAMRSWG